jgi:2-polyprenyl-3-methyl-5-hydroxy-6-metoxy-1,4-benzoquinol methylase
MNDPIREAGPSRANSAYPGSELALFSQAKNWKHYWSARVAPFVSGRVLDVGAGTGATIQVLAHRTNAEWTALEPDRSLAEEIRASVQANRLPSKTRVIHGDLHCMPPNEQFDTVLYIDVLEHIESDASELERAAAALVPGGHLVVLAPAHNWLLSPFDRAVGHFRRYNRQSLRQALPSALLMRDLRYLDSVGLLASIGNKLLLRQSMPTAAQIRLWDKLMVPMSTIADRLTAGRLGKSLLMVARKR